MRISDWSSDVCSSDLLLPASAAPRHMRFAAKVAIFAAAANRSDVFAPPWGIYFFSAGRLDRQMARIVMKFGGTSMAGLERIRNVDARVKHVVEQGHEVAVVVSAMAGETDRLGGDRKSQRLH